MLGCQAQAFGCDTRFPQGTMKQNQRTQRCPAMNWLQVITQTGPGITGPGRFLVPTGSAQHILLIRPGVRVWGREPPLPQQICKRGQGCPLRNLELHGWTPGLPDEVGAGVGGYSLRAGLSPWALPAFRLLQYPCPLRQQIPAAFRWEGPRLPGLTGDSQLWPSEGTRSLSANTHPDACSAHMCACVCVSPGVHGHRAKGTWVCPWGRVGAVPQAIHERQGQSGLTCRIHTRARTHTWPHTSRIPPSLHIPRAPPVLGSTHSLTQAGSFHKRLHTLPTRKG